MCFEVLGEHSDLTSTFILIVSGGEWHEAMNCDCDFGLNC